ncbi:MAG: hypothetical protein GY910_06060 [bacterium]|nr:hypothetical protein [bacterium]
MRRIFGLTGMIILLATSAQAREHESGFGFAISVPDVWLVLTRSEVAKKAELFEEDGSDRLGSVPAAMRRAVFERVEAGQLEIFYRREGLSGSFVDNVNIMRQPADLPATESQLTGVCRVLPSEFSRVFGRPIAMDRCEIRMLATRPALYLQFDGAIPGTTTLQYQLQRRAGGTLVLTATASTSNLTRMLSEFEEMVDSIRIR